MVDCGYCKDEIKGEHAMFDAKRNVYLHDGPRLRTVGLLIPVCDDREHQRELPESQKMCAQLYKAKVTIEGQSVLLDKVRLEDVVSSE